MQKKYTILRFLMLTLTLSCFAKTNLSKKQKWGIGGGSAAVGIGGGSAIGYGVHKHNIDKEYNIPKKDFVSKKTKSYAEGYDHPYTTLYGSRSLLHKAEEGDTRRRIFFDFSRTRYNLLKENNSLGEYQERADGLQGMKIKEAENKDFYGKTENTFFRYLNDGEDPLDDYGLRGFFDMDGDYHLFATEEDQSQSHLYHAYEENQRALDLKKAQLARKKEKLNELKIGKQNSTSDVASGTVTTNTKGTGGKAASNANNQVNSDASAINGGVDSSQSTVQSGSNQQNQNGSNAKEQPGENSGPTGKGGGEDIAYDVA